VPNLRQLEYLVALSETLHFRRAAERTNTTQPTLSEQIKALEERLGVQLVERSTARVVITPAGARIVEIAKRMLRDASEIRALASVGSKELSGLIRIGLPPTIGPYLMQRAAPQLHKAYPDLRLYMREELPKALPRALEDGVHDIIITPLPVRAAEIETVTLFREPLLFTVGADHPLALRKVLHLADLKDQEVLALGPGHMLHDPIQALCKEAGARLKLEFEGTSLDMLREMIVMGFGGAFMPGLYVKRELETDPSVKCFEIKDRSIFSMIGMSWRSTSARGPTYVKLADFLKGTLSGHGTKG
jgi:LysR family hydrogen peroxide-inducible transcriptional activator